MMRKMTKTESFDNTNKTDCDILSNIDAKPQKGVWLGEKGNSKYVLNKDFRPKDGNSYNNPENKTVGQLGKDMGDENPSVSFIDSCPIFDKDYATCEGKPYFVKFEEDRGIGEYLVIKLDRRKLHEECFRRLAAQLGKSVDEIKVFKGDAEPINRLAEKWECSEKEVWERCKNPNKVQRVWHECKDKQTVQLVPRLYHMIPHTGGIEAIQYEIKKRCE